MAANLLSDNYATESGRNHGVTFDIGEFGCEFTADFRRQAGVLEYQRALKVLAAVQPGAQDEMSRKQRAGAGKGM